MYPLTGVMSSTAVSRSYIDSVSMTFIGGFFLALALDRWHFQKRIALWIITTTLHYDTEEDKRLGPSKWKIARCWKRMWTPFYSISNIHRIPLIFLAFITVTFLLSTILSNTACALVMVPNAIGVIQRLEKALTANIKQRSSTKQAEEGKSTADASTEESEYEQRKQRNIAAVRPMAIALLIGIPFAASIGGIVTLVGTPTNLIFARQMETIGQPVTFITWLAVGIPIGVVIQICLAIVLMVLYVIPSWYKINKAINNNDGEDADNSLTVSLLDNEHSSNMSNIELGDKPITVTDEAEEAASTTQYYEHKDQQQAVDSTEDSATTSKIKSSATAATVKHIDIGSFREEYASMGRITYEELAIAFIFFVTICLWTTRSFDLGSFKGWEVLFTKGYVSEGTIAALLGSLLFIVPSYHIPTDAKKGATYPTLMEWASMTKFPWDMILM